MKKLPVPKPVEKPKPKPVPKAAQKSSQAPRAQATEDPLTQTIRMAQILEQVLERYFGASGRGLHEKISTANPALPDSIVRKLRFIATIRNRAAHEDVGEAARSLGAVRENFDSALDGLRTLHALNANASSQRASRGYVYSRSGGKKKGKLWKKALVFALVPALAALIVFLLSL